MVAQPLLAFALLAAIMLGSPPSARAVSVDFPTGEAGYSVMLSGGDGPESRSACILAVSRGLPTMGLSINLFSDDEVTVNGVWPNKVPDVEIGKPATARINNTFVVGTVIFSGNLPNSSDRIISIRVPEKSRGTLVSEVLTEIMLRGAHVEFMADGHHFPSVRLPPAERANAALLTCMERLVAPRH